MKEHGRLVAIIIAAVVVIAGGIFGGMTLFSDKGDESTPPEPPLVEQNDSVLSFVNYWSCLLTGCPFADD